MRKIIFEILRRSIGIKKNIRDIELTAEQLNRIYKLLQRHDVSHLPAKVFGGGDNEDIRFVGEGDVDAVLQKYSCAQSNALFRYFTVDSDFEAICELFERHGIDFIPLKGMIMREYYPEPWMRTYGDVDILVREEVLDKATDLLVSELGYRNEGRGYHDVSLISRAGILLELHFSLTSGEPVPEVAKILDTVWDIARVKEGYSSFHLMSDEIFYFYHILHMVQHFENGGCGIRQFLDIWVMNHRANFDRSRIDTLLSESGYLKFERAVVALSEVWFSGDEHTEITAELENFVIKSGVYGTTENKIAVQQNKKNGKAGFILSRLFLSFDMLAALYPSLKKHKWLFPFYQVRRWFRLMFKNRSSRSVNEINANLTITDERRESTARLFDSIGL